MVDKDTYCPSPWHGGFFTQDGQSVCCAYPPTSNIGIAEYLSSSEVISVKQALSSGQIPSGCRPCFNVESQGGKSIRQIFQRTYAESGIDMIRDPAQPSRPQMIEIRLSNLCNFRCRICYPKYSSSIAHDIESYPHLRQYFTIDQISRGRIDGTAEFTQEIIDMIPQLRWINFTGGEPMIIPAVITIMDAIVDGGHSQNITVHITTNCSTINPRIMERLSQFQRVLLTLSIDAVGPAAEYIRDGTIWSRVDQNIQRFKQLHVERIGQKTGRIDVNVNTALSAYSVLVLDDTVDYLMRLKKDSRIRLDMLLVDDISSPYSLQGRLLDKGIESLGKAIGVINSYVANQNDVVLILSQLENLKKSMQDSNQRRDFDKFVRYTQDLDRIRGQSFGKTFGLELAI